MIYEKVFDDTLRMRWNCQDQVSVVKKYANEVFRTFLAGQKENQTGPSVK